MHCVLYHALAGEFTQIQLAEQCALDKTTMVVTMDALESAGLAERRPPGAGVGGGRLCFFFFFFFFCV